ncbi:hypothetical protein GCM10027189_29520 [Rufibacter soli]
MAEIGFPANTSIPAIVLVLLTLSYFYTMARRGRRTLGMPLPISGRFLPATMLIILGLGLMIYIGFTKEVRGTQDLVVKEGTLSNYSFKKTKEGERDYGLWLKEFPERFVMTDRDEASFDTAAFKAAIQPGQRLRVEYSTRENLMENGGLRKLYGLAIPSKNITYFEGRSTVQHENNGIINYVMYALLAAGVGLYAWQLVQMQREKREYRS